jgi:hypothetical protein
MVAKSPDFKFDSKYRYLAGRTFDCSLMDGRELREFLKSWGGHDLTFEEQFYAKIDLNQLLGREADLSLVHIKSKGYATPYVLIDRICPPGQLVPVASEQNCFISHEFLPRLERIEFN